MMDTIKIEKIIRSCFENLCSRKTESLQDINKFLETHDPPKLNQEELHKLNRSISSNETEEAIKSLTTKKSPGPDAFSAEFYKTFKEELIPILLKVFQAIEKEGILPNSFYEASITVIPKPDRRIKERKFRPVFLINKSLKFWQIMYKNIIKR